MDKNRCCKLNVSLFGSFKLTVDDCEISPNMWKSKKALTLFKLLAAKHGERVDSDFIAELLWPSNDSTDNKHNLQRIVYLLRKTLVPMGNENDECCIRQSNGLYWLDLSPESSIDTKEFKDLVKKSEQLELEDPQNALLCCQSAINLYAGDFLSEELHDNWIIQFREYYRGLYIETTIRVANLLVDYQKDYEKAVEICRAALKKYPYAEELYQAIIRTLIKAQKYGEAAREYEQCCQMLMKDFRLNPSPATQGLMLEMKNLTTRHWNMDLQTYQVQAEGAYVCEPSVFKSIVELERRRIKRNNGSVALISINSYINKDAKDQHYNLFWLTQHSLRKGDTVCVWSNDKIVALLPEINHIGTKIVVKRLDEILQLYFANQFSLVYTMVDNDDTVGAEQKVAEILF